MGIRAKVVEVVWVQDLALVACDLMEGEITLEAMVNVEGASGSWKVVGLKPASHKLHVEGRRGLTLKPLGGDGALKIGAILIG